MIQPELTDSRRVEVREQPCFEHQERLQFDDGRIALGFRTPGDVMAWNKHKYGRYLDKPSENTALMVLASGKVIAIGGGVAVLLPELDRSTGNFGKPGDRVSAVSLHDLGPDGLPDATIDEPWPVVDYQDPVKEVLLKYKREPNDPVARQVPMPDPFISAEAHINHVLASMPSS